MRVLDIETDGDPWSGGLLAVGWADLDSGDIEVYRGSGVPVRVVDDLADPDVPIVTHMKYDLRWLRLQGWDVEGPFIDTQVMAWLLDENQPLDLESLAFKYTGLVMDKRLRRKKNRVFFVCDDGSVVPIAEAPWPQLRDYNYRDVSATVQLYVALLRELMAQKWYEYWVEEEVPFTGVLLDMECAGLPIDVDATTVLADRLRVQTDVMAGRLKKSIGLPPAFNLNSPDQVAALLFDVEVVVQDRLPVEAETPEGFEVTREGRKWKHGVWRAKGRRLKPTPRTESSGRPSTKTPILFIHHGDDEWVREFIEWRKDSKLLTTYLDAWPDEQHDGRLYATFKQTGTVTGRLSSSEPNLQNVPVRGEWAPEIRGLFKGDFILADYSQLELRLMAHFSKDPVLIDAYLTGKDLHAMTAQRIFGRDEVDAEERYTGKTLNYAMGYGAAPPKVTEIFAKDGHYVSEEDAKRYMAELQKLYPTLFEWCDAVSLDVHTRGYVTTLAGRRRRLSSQFKDRKNYKLMGYGERQAVNAMIQGSAADVVRRTMLESHRRVRGLVLLLQVHDELLWEKHEERDDVLEVLKEIGETAHGFDLRVPLVFEPKFVDSWRKE